MIIIDDKNESDSDSNMLIITRMVMKEKNICINTVMMMMITIL